MIGVSGSEKLQQQLEEFSTVFKRKLENMVEEFAVEIAAEASKQTPEGNQSDIDKGFGSYWQYYKERNRYYRLPLETGFHKGAWEFSLSPNFSFSAHIRSISNMLNDVRNESESIVLGRDFFIGASGPGFYALDSMHSSAQAPNGIMKPTLAMIMSVSKSDLQKFYEKG
jgi:hypothetical protein